MDLLFLPPAGPWGPWRIDFKFCFSLTPAHLHPNPLTPKSSYHFLSDMKNDYKMHPCPLMLCLHAKSNCPSMWVFLDQSCHQMKYIYLVKYEIYRIYTCLHYLFLDVNSLSSTYIKKSQWKMIGKSIKLFFHFSLLTLNGILVFRRKIYHNQLFWYKKLEKCSLPFSF